MSLNPLALAEQIGADLPTPAGVSGQIVPVGRADFRRVLFISVERHGSPGFLDRLESRHVRAGRQDHGLLEIPRRSSYLADQGATSPSRIFLPHWLRQSEKVSCCS